MLLEIISASSCFTVTRTKLPNLDKHKRLHIGLYSISQDCMDVYLHSPSDLIWSGFRDAKVFDLSLLNQFLHETTAIISMK